MKRLLRQDEGSAAVEFAILTPVLALVVRGIMQLGAIAQTGIIASNAARGGARYAAVSDAQHALTYLTDAGKLLRARHRVFRALPS